MDSITQFALGAAIGEACLGSKSGYRAILWGGIAGTIPDLDVLLMPLYTEVEQLSVHRGFSHSIVFSFLASPPLAWLARKIHGEEKGTFRQWLVLFFLAILTHPLLDSLTLYGTQLFLPFSDYRVSLNTISIVDPLYTLPLLTGVFVCLFMKRNNPLRKKWSKSVLVISCIYLLLTAGHKIRINDVFEKEYARQELPVKRYMTNPTLFSNLLWYAVAETDSGYYSAYYSIFDGGDGIRMRYISRREDQLEPYQESEAIHKLKWFSNGYYAVQEKENGLVFVDLRFGRTSFDIADENAGYIFCYKLVANENSINRIERIEPVFPTSPAIFFGALFDRIGGNHQ